MPFGTALEAVVTVLEDRTPLHLPELHLLEEDGLTHAVDGAAPNWVAVDSAGRFLLEALRAADHTITFGELTSRYAGRYGLGAGKAWLHVHDFLTSLDRAGMLSDQPFPATRYPGRSALIRPEGLRELWLQLNNNCNLACGHCLVGSGPGKEIGLPLERLKAIVDQAVELGTERLYITGGEPFVRRDIFSLLKHATEVRGLEVIVLTNGTAFKGTVREGLGELDRNRIRFQISIDGATAATNDPIRGTGTFDRALDGARLLSDLGFEVSLTTVTTKENLAELPDIPAIVRAVGARSQHLMWTHRRGRAAASLNGYFPDPIDLVDAVLRTAERSPPEKHQACSQSPPPPPPQRTTLPCWKPIPTA
jgi:pyruvate-formate lyase-activating enzyme